MQKFFWLDDNPERSPEALNLGSAIEVEVQFFNLKNTNLEEELAKLVAVAQPELIILDHNLQDAHLGVFRKGSTAATIIRETWPECPIVCVTGEDVNFLNNQQKVLYDEVFSISQISCHYRTIKSIADSFGIAKQFRPAKSEELVKLLNAPQIDTQKLISILPTALKDNFNDSSLVVELCRWIRGVLIKRPGFLYNKLWLATLIGVKISSFEKISKYFEVAKYDGLFANDNEPRWWKSTALEILYDISETKGLPWQRGRDISEVEIGDYSVCYASNEDFPETVAFLDQSSIPIEEPMKMKYTELHPEYERLLHFEDIRLMTAAE